MSVRATSTSSASKMETGTPSKSEQDAKTVRLLKEIAKSTFEQRSLFQKLKTAETADIARRRVAYQELEKCLGGETLSFALFQQAFPTTTHDELLSAEQAHFIALSPAECAWRSFCANPKDTEALYRAFEYEQTEEGDLPSRIFTDPKSNEKWDALKAMSHICSNNPTHVKAWIQLARLIGTTTITIQGQSYNASDCIRKALQESLVMPSLGHSPVGLLKCYDQNLAHLQKIAAVLTNPIQLTNPSVVVDNLLLNKIIEFITLERAVVDPLQAALGPTPPNPDQVIPALRTVFAIALPNLLNNASADATAVVNQIRSGAPTLPGVPPKFIKFYSALVTRPTPVPADPV